MFSLSDWLLNAIPIALVVLLGFALRRAAQEPLWAEAYRRLLRNRTAIFAFCLMSLYALAALLDSLGATDLKTGNRVTILDRIFARKQERTYSAPLARRTTSEPNPRALNEPGTHLLGTDGVGNDVLYQTLKGCKTAFIVGGLTTLIATPLALLVGLLAGYYGKWVDDVVQYTYTTLASIPNILLLIALILVLGRGLPQLCLALGITSWVGLCRLVRGETLKHRDREYVRGARALGVSPFSIMTRHILPNLLPTVIISVTLGFSGRILAETTLSYLGVGVDAGTGSWGNMIDAARSELARYPVIWWNLTSAATALFGLVLSFNLLGDALRDAIDPRLRS